MQNKNLKNLLILPFIVMVGFFIFAGKARAEYITTDVIWTKAQSPIIISENVIVWYQGKLTIEPGVVVKFYTDRFIGVGGLLNANGTVDEPIVFTSIKDDEYGGDSNNDGDGSKPQSLDWGYLYFAAGSESTLDNTIIKYGGGFSGYHSPAVKISRGKLNIVNSTIFNNGGGISNDRGELIINNSSIYNNMTPFIGGVFVDYGLGNNNREDVIVEATNNWWGTDEGPCPWRTLIPPNTSFRNINIIELCGSKTLVDVGVVYDPWLTSEPTQEPSGPDPVIIVPGIMGSWKKDEEWIIDPILHTYDNLIEAMIQSGYVLDENLFLFPYNWRSDNVLTAGLLKEKIDEVKTQTGREKVDIVAHSMGGLISRFYVQGNEYENDVDQLIFLDTPHQGSPESYLVYEGAYFTGNVFVSRFKKYVFQIEAAKSGYLSLVNYIREQITSTEQLLPIYNYLQTEVSNNWIYKMYPVQYPRNTFLENLNVSPAVEILKNRAEITNIISSSGVASTLTAIRVISDPDIYDNKWIDGYPDDIEGGDLSGLITGDGDGTVPYNSLNFLDGVDIVKIFDTEHREIVTKAQQDAIEILTGERPDDYYSGLGSAIKRVLFIRVYSPVDFVVYAPDGKMIGKNFSSITEINEITGAFYSGFDSEAEFVTIINPDDGDYRVELIGTDNGIYELGIDILEDGAMEPNENLITGIISSGDEESFNFNYKESDEISEIIIQKEVSIEDLEKDLNELYNSEEISKKQTFNYLSAKFRKLIKIYDKIEKEKIKKKDGDIKRFIRETNKIIKKLEFYLKKNWLTQAAYNVLNNDINNLINNLN